MTRVPSEVMVSVVGEREVRSEGFPGYHRVEGFS